MLTHPVKSAAMIEAEERVKRLEGDKLQREIDLSIYDQQLKIEELNLKRHEGRKAEFLADSAQRSEFFATASGHYHHECRLNRPIRSEYMEEVIQQVEVWHREDPECDMKIIINSPGGDVFTGWELYDQLFQFSLRGGGTHHLTTVIHGAAASMAGVIAQAGDTRLIGPKSWLMIHEVSSGVIGKTHQIKDEAEFCKRLNDQIADLYTKQSNGKTSLEQFNTGWAHGKDWWLQGQEAIDRGFVDRIG